jgi:CheY-like chemotaxis protein
MISKKFIDGQMDSHCGSGDEGGVPPKCPSIVQGMVKGTLGSETVFESGGSSQ